MNILKTMLSNNLIVKTVSYEIYKEIISEVKNNIELLSDDLFEFGDQWKNENKDLYPPKKYLLKHWMTYNKCINCTFEGIENGIVARVTVWDGDMLCGDRKKVRFYFEWSLQDHKIIRELVVRNLELKADWEYDKFLEKQRQDFIKKFVKKNVVK